MEIPMKKSILSIGTVAAVAALVLGASMPALALATSPDGDSFYSAGYWDTENGGGISSAFWQVHPGSPSTLTVIQATHDDPQMITDGAYDANAGKSYVIGYGYGPECQLWSVDITTGAYTLIGPITQDHNADEGGPEPSTSCNAFDILDAGTAYITIFGTELYRLDLTTGAATYIADVVDSRFIDTGLALSVISEQPGTGTVYAIDFNGFVYTLDLTTGVATYLINPSGLWNSFDADFDSAGTWWVTVWDDDAARLVSITDPAHAADSLEAGDPVEGWFTDSLWIIPAPAVDDGGDDEVPALANTGTSPLPLAFGALLLLLAGTGVVVLRPRRA
ncbi:hypothetical protein BKA04_000406 [Cryobacterium mesophilum]|uniref:Uncharacterized protein n=1 Tax=Terrimesophilobacter mesophilus TaxID=433647 RepID=A0A4R8V9M9_9MICO|nr:hypothetical protein [Terrimesophilobacter mesophilus]MBB5632183.1 hypothetical protein [Terrimesophilobacter mesophilus]TFB79046.1 hypothetical protein E3N84_02600 [Terrimesophilobacter mesophilus]